MPRYVLLDIEGTTTPIDFVHKKLFPYAKAHLSAFVAAHAGLAAVRSCLEATKDTIVREMPGSARPEDDAALAALAAWIDADRKHPALKTLQGLIWQRGYDEGVLVSELYPDVAPTLRLWRARGLGLGIYSSGSVAAQKLLFAHTPAGDLNPLFSDYFDTAVGGKREAASYGRVLSHLRLAGADVAFLSDVAEELDAAASHAIRTVHLLRPGTEPVSRHPGAKDLPEAAAILGL